MKAIDRKLWRDLWSMRGQALAIGVVIASGVATFVMSLSTLHSLHQTRENFYHDYHFAHVFASLKRAPEGLRSRIKEIPGVDRVEIRVVAAVTLDIEAYPEPVTGRLISIPDNGKPALCQLSLREGRTIAQGRDNEVVVSESFAEAHGFAPGDQLSAVINGRRKTMTIVGIALSPEYVYQIAPGGVFPDFERYGILWMARTPLATAYDMEGAFNDLVLTVAGNAQVNTVCDRIDLLLEPYGGLGAYGRKDQLSHRYLSEEFRQLDQMATVFPVIFLGVAAFLLNVVINRLVTMQREQCAALKAFGYSNMGVGIHYLKFVVLIVLFGTSAGVVAGAWLGKGLSDMYVEYYRFPCLDYDLGPLIVLTAAMVSMASAVIATLFAVRKAAILPPAEAMRPEPPGNYRQTLVERWGLKDVLSQPSRMIARNIERRPFKALLSVTGIAFACAVMIAGTFFEDSLDFMVTVQFGLSQREDLSVTFVEPASKKALYELQAIDGVQYGEEFRSVPARLRFQHRSYRTAICGMKARGNLQRLFDADLQSVELPTEGIVLTDHLGGMLGVRPGDRLTVEVLERNRPVREIPVAALISQYIGVSAYMEISALNRLMREGNAISGVYLATDPARRTEILSALKKMPRIAGVEARANAVANFYETMGEQLLIFTFFIALLAGTIAFGVVYNTARITLSERSRELASLRVLGFTRGEISYILLGELALLTLVAIPFGFFIGYALCTYMVMGLQTDLFRIPLILELDTYALAATVVLISACVSGLTVRRKLDCLDLVAVLKTKE